MRKVSNRNFFLKVDTEPNYTFANNMMLNRFGKDFTVELKKGKFFYEIFLLSIGSHLRISPNFFNNTTFVNKPLPCPF